MSENKCLMTESVISETDDGKIELKYARRFISAPFKREYIATLLQLDYCEADSLMRKWKRQGLIKRVEHLGRKRWEFTTKLDGQKEDKT